MNTVSSLWVLILMTVLAAVCLGLLLYAWRLRRDQYDVTERLERLEDMMEVLKRELSGYKQSQQVGAHGQMAETAYAHAIRLARQGLDSAAVASGCGISRGEAELIVALYRSTQKP